MQRVFKDKHRFEYAEGILNSWRQANVRHKAGYYVIGIADRTSAADEPEMRRICSQFVPRWDALDWTRV